MPQPDKPKFRTSVSPADWLALAEERDRAAADRDRALAALRIIADGCEHAPSIASVALKNIATTGEQA